MTSPQVFAHRQLIHKTWDYNATYRKCNILSGSKAVLYLCLWRTLLFAYFSTWVSTVGGYLADVNFAETVSHLIELRGVVSNSNPVHFLSNSVNCAYGPLAAHSVCALKKRTLCKWGTNEAPWITTRANQHIAFRGIERRSVI